MFTGKTSKKFRSQNPGKFRMAGFEPKQQAICISEKHRRTVIEVIEVAEKYNERSEKYFKTKQY